jgi:hypothetical protein
LSDSGGARRARGTHGAVGFTWRALRENVVRKSMSSLTAHGKPMGLLALQFRRKTRFKSEASRHVRLALAGSERKRPFAVGVKSNCKVAFRRLHDGAELEGGSQLPCQSTSVQPGCDATAPLCTDRSVGINYDSSSSDNCLTEFGGDECECRSSGPVEPSRPG